MTLIGKNISPGAALLLSALALALSAAGCGGGGDSSSATATSAAPARPDRATRVEEAKAGAAAPFVEAEGDNSIPTFGAEASAAELAQAQAALLALRHPQALLAPEALHALLVDAPALFEQAGVGAAVAPALLQLRDLAQALSQGGLVRGNLRLMALCRSVLAGDPARPTLGEAETVLEHQDRSAPPGRA